MHGMNYRITLPADYDMAVIRDRVRTRGHLLDTFGGLGLKAYLVRERGADGAPVNEYGPFYLWNSARGMNRFLWEGGFQGIVDDFGRPEVRHWTGLGFARGPAADGAPGSATRSERRLTADEDLPALFARELDELRVRAERPGVHCAALLVDPRHWELVRFTLWRDTAPAEPDTERFQVLHLSRPGFDAIEEGRQW